MAQARGCEKATVCWLFCGTQDIYELACKACKRLWEVKRLFKLVQQGYEEAIWKVLNGQQSKQSTEKGTLGDCKVLGKPSDTLRRGDHGRARPGAP